MSYRFEVVHYPAGESEPIILDNTDHKDVALRYLERHRARYARGAASIREWDDGTGFQYSTHYGMTGIIYVRGNEEI